MFLGSVQSGVAQQAMVESATNKVASKKNLASFVNTNVLDSTQASKRQSKHVGKTLLKVIHAMVPSLKQSTIIIGQNSLKTLWA